MLGTIVVTKVIAAARGRMPLVARAAGVAMATSAGTASARTRSGRARRVDSRVSFTAKRRGGRNRCAAPSDC